MRLEIIFLPRSPDEHLHHVAELEMVQTVLRSRGHAGLVGAIVAILATRAAAGVLERAVRLLAKGEDPQRVLEALSHGLTNKLMHGPTRFLNQAEGEHKAEAGRVVRELFNLSRDHH